MTEFALDETRRHGRDLAAACGKLLADAGFAPKALAAVYAGVGPGSYTGLRVGVMTAKTLAFTVNCDFVPVPTFAAVAHGIAGEVTVVSDALQGLVYRQRFADGAAADELRIGPAADIGPGRIVGPAPVPGVEMDVVPIRAAALLAAGRAVQPLSRAALFSAEPLYLRGSSAEEKLKSAAI